MSILEASGKRYHSFEGISLLPEKEIAVMNKPKINSGTHTEINGGYIENIKELNDTYQPPPIHSSKLTVV